MNCDDICMCVVNKQFGIFIPFMLTCSMMRYLTSTAVYVSLWCVCNPVVVFGLSVRLSWYLMLMRWLM